MNCTQIEKLLPLYAGHDLSGRREQLIAEHLQSCAACSNIAAEYRETRDLMPDFMPPVFNEEAYAEIRKGVWERIETESRAPSLFEAIAACYQPRFILTAAAALLIAVSVVGVYFLNKRSAVRSDAVASVPLTALTPGPTAGEKPGSGLPRSNEGITEQRQADVKRQRKPDRKVAPDRGDSLVAYSPDAQAATNESSSPITDADNLDLSARDSSKSLRMEIQTRDPNIRIIWFTQRDPKPVAHSKGIQGG
jgi:hypothetical protein